MPKENQEFEHPGTVVEGNDTSGFIGVDPMYQNYANETEAPLTSSKDDEGYAKVAEHMESLATENYRGKTPNATHPSERTPNVAPSTGNQSVSSGATSDGDQTDTGSMETDNGSGSSTSGASQQ